MKTKTAQELSSEDREFMKKAAQAGIAEVRAGEMALEKSDNDDVREFAQRMIDDHSKATDKLKQLAKAKNETLPTEPTQQQKRTAEDLSELDGEDFDAEYMDVQVSDHEKVIELFEDEIEDGSNSDVIAFAEKILPTLRKHLEMAENISDEL